MHLDERALKLTRALQTYDLDNLVPLVQGELKWPPKQILSNLKFIFQHAQLDNLNLLHPPPDFQQWLQTPLRETIKGPGTASSSTINARVSTLNMLYNLLLDEGLLLQHPLRKLERPLPDSVPNHPPTEEELGVLLAHARSDPALYAALLLLTRHGLHVTELLALRWPHLHHATGTLLRRLQTVTLDQDSYQALDNLLKAQGGPLFDPQGKIFPYQNQDALRTRIFQVTQHANLPFIGPARLRKAALRGTIQGHAPSLPGDTSAQQLAEQLSERLGPPARLKPRTKKE